MLDIDLVQFIENETGIKKERWGCISIESSGDELYTISVIVAGKTVQGSIRSGRARNYGFDDAIKLFKAGEIQVYNNKNDRKKKKTIEIRAMVHDEIKNDAPAIAINTNEKVEW